MKQANEFLEEFKTYLFIGIFFRILIENPTIYQLYNELVVNQIVTAEDFWKNYVDVINNYVCR